MPCLFVSGTRDPFGTPDELEAATADDPRARSPTTWIDGQGHDLKGADAELASTVAGWLATPLTATQPVARGPRG